MRMNGFGVGAASNFITCWTCIRKPPVSYFPLLDIGSLIDGLTEGSGDVETLARL